MPRPIALLLPVLLAALLTAAAPARASEAGIASCAEIRAAAEAGLVADGPGATVAAMERDGLICRRTVSVQPLPSGRAGGPLYGEGGPRPWERGYAVELECFDADPAAAPSAPRFEDFPPFEIIAPEAVAPRLDSHPLARRYRTRIREGAERGAAFAGHLAVAEWGCGTQCRQFAFVDARDGRVHWGPQAEFGAEYRRDSRLFVVNPPDRLPPGAPVGTRRYVWDGTALVPLE